MQGLRWTTALGFAGVTALLVVSCGKPPAAPPPKLPSAPAPAAAAPAAPQALPPFQAHVSLSTAADVNPDASGRPSPIVVRIYQLKDDAAFAAAEFAPLFDDDQKVLSGSMINRRELVMTPGAQQTISDFAISLDAKFVGVVAAFRDIRNAQWRVIVPAGRRDLTITVDRLRVTLAPAGS